jgi:hypothetical protein
METRRSVCGALVVLALFLCHLSATPALAAPPGGAPVVVQNTPDNPVPVVNSENPDRSPYVEALYDTIPEGTASWTFPLPVPANKRVVIEHIAVRCTTTSPTDTFPDVTAFTIRKNASDGLFYVTEIPLFGLERRVTCESPESVCRWSNFANVKLYSEYTTGYPPVSIIVLREGNSSAFCYVVVNGHTVSVP